MKPIQKASVCGLGKLGACIAATLAQRGFEVVGIDIDAEKVKQDQRRPAAGGGTAVWRRRSRRAGRGCAPRRTTGKRWPRTSRSSSRPRPSLPDGSFSNEFLLRAMQPVAAAVREKGKKGHLFVCSSTTTPGAVDSVLIPMLERETGGVCGRDFGVCYNPEFIALGNVVKGLLEPDMVLIGESDPASGAALEEMYKKYNQN